MSENLQDVTIKKLLEDENMNNSIRSIKSKSNNQLILKTTKGGQPYFKYGKFQIYPYTKDNQLVKDTTSWMAYDNSGHDYLIDELKDEYQISDFEDLITPNLINDFNKANAEYINSLIKNVNFSNSKLIDVFNSLINEGVIKGDYKIYELDNVFSFCENKTSDYIIEALPYEFIKRVFINIPDISDAFHDIFNLDDNIDKSIRDEIFNIIEKSDLNFLNNLYDSYTKLSDLASSTDSGYHFICFADIVYLAKKYNIYPQEFIDIIKSQKFNQIKYLKSILGNIMLYVYNKFNEDAHIINDLNELTTKYSKIIGSPTKENILKYFKAICKKYGRKNKED